MNFRRAVIVDSAFWQVPLTGPEQRVYFYLCSRCSSRWHVSEQEIVTALHMDRKRVRAAINSLVDMHMVIRFKKPRPFATEYIVTLTTEKSWGMGSKRTHIMGVKRTPLRGVNAPQDGEQTHPPIDTIGLRETPRTGDTELLEVGMRYVRKWHFGRRPVGDRGIITSRHQGAILEMMRHLVSSGYDQHKRLEAMLDGIGDYLREPRDVISDNKHDFREKTLGRWLAHWTDQLHRAQSYLELREKNVVKMQPEEGIER